MACRLHTDLPLMLRKTIFDIAVISLLVIPFFGALADNSSSNVSNVSDVQTRLNDLQQRQDEMFKQLESEQRKVQTFFDDRLYFGGFFESAVTGIWGMIRNSVFGNTPKSRVESGRRFERFVALQQPVTFYIGQCPSKRGQRS